MPRCRFVLPVAFAACGAGATGTDATPIDPGPRAAVLAHLATAVIAPLQAAAATAVDALPPAIEALCDGLEVGPAAAALDAARAAWRAAASAWQAPEAVLVGPAAMDEQAVRDRIYAWPLFGSCSLDRDIASAWADPAGYDVATRLNNARSLAAVEYLLFRDAPAHTCPTVPAGWDALGVDLPGARCQLAHTISLDVAAQARALATAWSEGYTTQLAQAGTASSSIASAQAGLNLISDGLITYADRMVKSMKLGETTGTEVNVCGTVQMPCVAEVEHRWADHGVPAVRVNLATLRAVLTGDADLAGPGFDDLLVGAGAPDLAAELVGALDNAIVAADALGDSLLGALEQDLAAVTSLHAAVQAVTDLLKSQFLTVLALDIPDDVATDND